VYGAYKVEEELREWDRSVRDEAVLYLTQGEKQLTTLLEHAVTLRDRAMIARIERTRKQAHGVKEQLRTAVAGYFPRFSPIQIREERARGRPLSVMLDEKSHHQMITGQIPMNF
jgi:hypothetical protein